ncbi:ATP-binding protein [Halothermothrix orenii]|uniref:Predicted ATPase (AAA+ superfamily) n=1 Tax=Halothermothrix orenii (strain H 168 / OCM 544 / DSM 9562) TaxID=373903 RepID=B8CYE4_HALOH|nr:ATP-binding protein [Halothermothrix orenii]ACL70313.1 predicted ATPase (AAA+ superfamily) [Halothermothrix orenii H 168]
MALDDLQYLADKFNKLVIYRDLFQDKVIKNIINLMASKNTDKENYKYNFYDLCYNLIKFAETHNVKGDVWRNYLIWRVMAATNIFTISAEKYGTVLKTSLYHLVEYDLKIIKEIYDKVGIKQIARFSGTGADILEELSGYCPARDRDNFNPLASWFDKILASFEGKSCDEILSSLIDFHYKNGAAPFNQWVAFRWKDGRFAGVRDHDPITFKDLIGYKKQKERLIKNTLNFLEGKLANNVLLFGDSGTGKSSSVKALVNKFAGRGLRLLEISKNQIKDIPDIVNNLKRRGLHFIIFLDDLSFEDFETDYKYLKAVMEGGIEVKPDNVLFYATSNRRHLVKEKWSDRDSNEVHGGEVLQEKLSLSERFGITITFPSPDRMEYLAIVKKMASRYSIPLGEDELEERALQWEMWHNGRSGRTARQFINHLLGEVRGRVN